ncbi:hypothetical protein KKF61_09095 [Patescibacteria group bacterium]|nr:hypothetical protein [Patescibacteria group bacterium]
MPKEQEKPSPSEHEEKLSELAGMTGLSEAAREAAAFAALEKQEEDGESGLGELLHGAEGEDDEQPEPSKEEESEEEEVSEDETPEEETEEQEGSKDTSRVRRNLQRARREERAAKQRAKQLETAMVNMENRILELEQGQVRGPLEGKDDDDTLTVAEAKELLAKAKKLGKKREEPAERKTRGPSIRPEAVEDVQVSETEFRQQHPDYDIVVAGIPWTQEDLDEITDSADPAATAYEMALEFREKSAGHKGGKGRVEKALKDRERVERTKTISRTRGGREGPKGDKTASLPPNLHQRIMEADEKTVEKLLDKYGAGPIIRP